MAGADKTVAQASQPAAPAPTSAGSPAKGGTRYFLCQGRSTTRGKYRGLLEVDAETGDGVSIYWSTQQIEVILTETALRECQADPEIVVVPIREVTAEDAAAHVRGPVVAGELAKLETASTEALEAEIARRKAAQAIAAKNGRGN